MEKDTHISKCESCGADMIYNPKTLGLYCPYCESQKAINKIPTTIRDYHLERDRSVVDDEMQAYKCPNCGGEVVFDAYVTSTACPFCSATNVVKLKNQKGLKPDGILPFLYTKEMAFEAGKNWIKKKFFALGAFKKNFKAENFNGVYVPSYFFSSNTYTKYHARLGKHYTVTVGSGKNRRTVTKTRWFTVRGELSRDFKDIIIEATRQLTQSELHKINPYDTESLEGYQRDYLAGFSAERNDASLDQGFANAKVIMDDTIQREALSRYSYDVVGSFNADTTYANIGFHYALIPIWVFGCKHKDKMYRYIVNGRTGRSYGKYPISAGKVCTIVFAVLAFVATVLALIYTQGA